MNNLLNHPQVQEAWDNLHVPESPLCANCVHLGEDDPDLEGKFCTCGPAWCPIKGEYRYPADDACKSFYT